MIQERSLKVLLAPVISEKATVIADKNRHFTFKVLSDATKGEIKRAVEQLFKVEVNNVRITNVKSKEKRFGRTIGYRKAWKKAYVSLKEGFDINFTVTEGK